MALPEFLKPFIGSFKVNSDWNSVLANSCMACLETGMCISPYFSINFSLCWSLSSPIVNFQTAPVNLVPHFCDWLLLKSIFPSGDYWYQDMVCRRCSLKSMNLCFVNYHLLFRYHVGLAIYRFAGCIGWLANWPISCWWWVCVEESRRHPQLTLDIRRPRRGSQQSMLLPHPGTSSHLSVPAWWRFTDSCLQYSQLPAWLLQLSSLRLVWDKLLKTTVHPEYTRTGLNGYKAVWLRK